VCKSVTIDGPNECCSNVFLQHFVPRVEFCCQREAFEEVTYETLVLDCHVFVAVALHVVMERDLRSTSSGPASFQTSRYFAKFFYNGKCFRQSCIENKNTHFMFNNFFFLSKIAPFMR
jgi:hypothetical protein